MGLPTKTEVEAWSDRAAALLRKNLDGFDGELSGAATAPLSVLIGASTDPEVRNALGASALAIDEHSLPENYATALRALTGRATFQAFVSALSGLATAQGFTNLEAYLHDRSATLHPLFAELARAVLGEAAFTVSDAIRTVFAPNYQSLVPDRVYTGADGSLADDTTDAGDADTGDVALFASDNHSLYIGSRRKFSQVILGLSTLASATITPTVSYWNGSAWVAVSGLTDNSVGLTRNDTLKWTVPADWERSYQDAGGTALAEKTPLYYLKISRTADALVTPPVATCVRIIPELIYHSGALHLGVPQPPLGLARVTAQNTIVVESIASVDITRFLPPGLRLRALTPFAANLTPTLAYVDQDGNDASQAQSAWTAPAALDTVAVTLAGGDTGARSVRTTGNAVTTTATMGVFEVYVAESRTPAL